MPFRVPVGGFVVVAGADARIPPGTGPAPDRECRSDGVGGAVWAEFPGQGMWEGEGLLVAHDLDLTNERALRQELGLGGGESPAAGELLARAYRAWGVGMADRLRGAFAFAVWDPQARTLFAATDPYGIRPVVYAEVPEGLVVGSRIRHVLLHPDVDRALDPDAIYQYLFFSAIPSPHTVYRGVRKLEPGHWIRWTPEGWKVGRYYDIRYRPDRSVDEGYWRRAIPLEVRRAVGRFVPLSDPDRTGCFLSGGTDSSSVAGYYTRLAGRPARTFSIGFDEPGYNELDYAHTAARHFGTEQHDAFVTPAQVLELLEHLPSVYDEPFGNSSVIPTYYCARFAREHGVEVLLAGDGGDEIFGGNERYVTNLVFERYRRIPGPLRKGVIEPLVRALPGRGVVYKAQRYIRRANIPNPDRFYSYNLLYEEGAARVFRPEFLDQVDPESFLRLARRHYAAAAPAHDTDRLLYLDMKFTITDNDLRKVTQMTEAAGVRVRYPLLDRDLVDFTATIPPELKVRPGRNRYVFKRAMDGFLPREIIEKTKHGFGLPVGPWFARHPQLNALVRDALLTPSAHIRDWIRPEFLEELHQGLYGDSPSYAGGNLWVFLVLEMWMRKAVNRKS
ncbi:asparagine synthetase B family protein [Deferrisoma camini]|uniref:asparagine synthetase B family protein n=1 Tax=Deferrisoma camini TaxID=1035120 RepID=UPI0004B2C6B0|nr:asparagine synthase-related protein [Deferrisoma camini]